MFIVFDVIKNGKNRSTVKSFRFDQKGGVIGRGDNVDFKLTDPQNYISNKHLYIEYQGGRYYARDESTNGTFLKHPRKKLAKGSPYLINASDVFIIGDHELQVRFPDEDYGDERLEAGILNEPEPIDAVKELIPDDFLDESVLRGYSDEKEQKNEVQSDIVEALNGDKNIRNFLEGKEDETRREGDEIRGSGDLFNEHFDIPRFSKEQRQIRAESPNADDSDIATAALRVLEDNLGIEILSLESQRRNALLAELSNVILRALEGLSASLHIKEQAGEELRLPPANKLKNNPIKLGKSTSELLKNADIGGGLGFMRLSDAVVNSFAEINAHTIALHGASKSALEAAASAFAPKNLEYKFESTGALKGFGRRSSLAWKAYCKTFENLNDDPSFGVEIIMPRFAKEYEHILFSVNLATTGVARESTNANAINSEE
jgi:type VI secretion system FHA domain protein